MKKWWLVANSISPAGLSGRLKQNAKLAEDETNVDLDGDLPLPKKGDLVWRDGKQWRIEAVITRHHGGGALRFYKVYLDLCKRGVSHPEGPAGVALLVLASRNPFVDCEGRKRPRSFPKLSVAE